MPNRIIRESCRTSRSLDRLSAEAERVFWRLITVADDYGRFVAEPTVLLANCFPLRVDRLKSRTVQKWFQELLTCEHVQTYVCNGQLYGFLVSWEKYQTRRAKTSKYPPPPPASICDQPRADVPEESRNRGIEESRNRGTRNALRAAADFNKFWNTYPIKRGKAKAEKRFKAALKGGAPLSQLLEAIENQQAERDRLTRAGEFVPAWLYPEGWLHQKRWLDEVAVNPPNAQPKATKKDIEDLNRWRAKRGEPPIPLPENG